MPMTSRHPRIALATSESGGGPGSGPGGGKPGRDAPAPQGQPQAQQGGGQQGGARLSRPLVPGIPSRRVDPSGVVTQQVSNVRSGRQAADQTAADRQAGQQDGPGRSGPIDGGLIVGAGITVKGGIQNCRRLVVHGTVQATVPADALDVGPDGRFEGRAEVREATIAGKFDGDLIVDGELTIVAGGRVEGRIRYRDLTVETGGQVAGEIAHIDDAPIAAQPTTMDSVVRPDAETARDTGAPAATEVAPHTADPGPEAEPTPANGGEAAPAGDSPAPDGAEPAQHPVPETGRHGHPSVDLTGGGWPAGNGAHADPAAAAVQPARTGNAGETRAAEPASDAEQDAERFYRSLARSNA